MARCPVRQCRSNERVGTVLVERSRPCSGKPGVAAFDSRKESYTHVVSNTVRKLIAVVLSMSVLLGGSGFGGAFAEEIQHDFGIEAGSQPADNGPRGAGSDHRCACHFSMHMVTLIERRSRETIVTAFDEPASVPETCRSDYLFDFLFRPPRFSLA